MIATTLKPPNAEMERRQVEYIDKIIAVLQRIFGIDKITKPGFIKNYVNYPDGRVKRVGDLATTLADLKEQENRENNLELADDIALPGDTAQ